MRKLFYLSFLLLLIAAWTGCGDSTHRLTPTSQLAFIRSASGGGAAALRTHPFELPNYRSLSLAHKVRTGAGLAPLANDNQAGTDSIVVIKNDGTGEKVIADQAGWFYAVQLSEDGKKGVAAAEDTNGYLQIYVVDMKTLTPVQLTSDAEYHEYPQLSADGKQVVFVKYMSDVELGQAVIMSASGGTENVISTPGIYVNFPSFTPDGKKIVFEEETNDTIDIMNVDGTGITVLTNVGGTSYFDEYPSVSPDGKSIVFSRYGKDTATSGEDIYSVAIDGTGLKQLTTDGKSWDPLFVNRKIAFVSYRDTVGDEIYCMNPDGTGQKRLTNNTVADYFAD